MSHPVGIRDHRESGMEDAKRHGAPNSTQKPKPWLAVVEWCAVALFAVIFIGRTFVPAWQTLRSEFPDYYLAAELYHHGIPLDRVYEWTWFQRQNDRLQVHDSLVSFAPNPPTLILTMLPLVRLQPLSAKRVWLVLNLGFLVLSLTALKRTTSLPWRRIILIASLCVLPLHIDFLYARHYVLILCLVCVAYYFARRGSHRIAGASLGIAAAVKLFPALSLILLVRQRNWRALAGFLVALTVLTAISIFLFGAEVHRVFLHEVLPQASRGDWLGPYVLSQNSFITLWSRLFLVEPELNPAPFLNSPGLFAVAMAVTVTSLLFGFLFSFRDDTAPRTIALQWATLIPLILLLTTNSSPDYPCLLIFAAIVGFDILLSAGRTGRAIGLLALYVIACAPMSGRLSNWFPVYRLAAITALYAILLFEMKAGSIRYSAKSWFAAGVAFATLLTLYNFSAIRNRDEDFSRRLPIFQNGARCTNPVAVANGIAFTEMLSPKYAAALLANGRISNISPPGDVLSLAGSLASPQLYFENATRSSSIVGIPVDGFPPNAAGAASHELTPGQEPALSANGRWLAFIREDYGVATVWLTATDSGEVSPQTVLPSTYRPLDVTVTNDGDVIAAAGRASDPRLLIVKRITREIALLDGFPHPARYPAISPDGKRLAFSRRDHGSWHLILRNIASGEEEQLTHAPCNATSSSWADDHTLLYATDCGRGVGLSAIARLPLSEKSLTHVDQR